MTINKFNDLVKMDLSACPNFYGFFITSGFFLQAYFILKNRITKETKITIKSKAERMKSVF